MLKLDKNITDFFSNNIIALVSLIASTIVAACIEFWIQYGNNTECFYYSTKCLNTKSITFDDIQDETKLSILEYAYPDNMKLWPYQQCIYKKDLEFEINQQKGGSNGNFVSNEAYEKEYNKKTCIYKPISDYSSYDGKPFPYNLADFAQKYFPLKIFKTPLKAFSFYFLYNVICIRYLIKKLFKLIFYGINHFKVLDSNVKSNLLFTFLLAFGIMIFFGGFIGLIGIIGMFAFLISLYYTTFSKPDLGRNLDNNNDKYYFMNNPYIYENSSINKDDLKTNFNKYYLISIGVKNLFKLFPEYPGENDEKKNEKIKNMHEYNNNMTFYPILFLNYIKYRYSFYKKQFIHDLWKDYCSDNFYIPRDNLGKKTNAVWGYIIGFALAIATLIFIIITFTDVQLWINIIVTLSILVFLLGFNYYETPRLLLPFVMFYLLNLIFYLIANIFILSYLCLLIITTLISGVFTNILATIYMTFSFVFNTFYIPLSHPLELFSIIKRHAKLLIILLLISVAVNAKFKLYDATAGLIGGIVALIVLYAITSGYNQILS